LTKTLFTGVYTSEFVKMIRKQITALILLLIFCSATVSISKIDVVKAESTICIRANGSVEGTDKIQRVGDVYTFTANIYGSIVVERGNVVLNGAGYRLQGNGNENGITLSYISNSTIKNLKLSSFNIGIVIMGSDNNKILENTITDNFRGLDVTSSENNTVSGNYITNNNDGIALENIYNNIVENVITNNTNIAIFLNGAGYNNIIKNNITKNSCGILVYICYNNVIYHNNFVNNTNHVKTDDSNGIWDNGREGNYWSDYEERYPDATETDVSGIWNTPYIISENNQDNYPLIAPVETPDFQEETDESEVLPIIVVISLIVITLVALGIFIYVKEPKR
jgi:parallel beta-helix repeat protein